VRIAFSPDIFVQQRYGGVSRYYANLALALNSVTGIDVRIIAPVHRNGYVAKLPKSIGYGLCVPIIPKTGRAVKCIATTLSEFQFVKYKPHVIHETYYATAVRGPKDARRVLTVFDMITEILPEYFVDSERVTATKRRAVERADHVLCISRETQKDLIEIFGIKSSKTSVTHLAFSPLIPAKQSGGADRKRRSYFLFVGARSGYKNFSGFLLAFSQSRLLKTNFDIVCFGGGSFNLAERRLVESVGLCQGQVQQREGGDDQLANEYAGACALVYPSLYEGFGIPPLEAMSLGCPVVASETSSIPEVVGDAAELFDPRSVASVRHAVERIASSESRRAELKRLGSERCKSFTWTKCAEETAACYRQLS
jgi:glycosyltransferase involved in cell wall biosynthesis